MVAVPLVLTTDFIMLVYPTCSSPGDSLLHGFSLIFSGFRDMSLKGIILATRFIFYWKNHDRYTTFMIEVFQGVFNL